MEFNCYKTKTGNLGIQKDYYQSLIRNVDKHFDRCLNIDMKPVNINECNLFCEFVFGINVDCKLISFDRIELSDINRRNFKMSRLLGDDIIYNDYREVNLANFSWRFNIEHDILSDMDFNRKTLLSSYDIESSVVPRYLFTNRGSGGIGKCVYGHNSIYSIKELYRIKHMMDYPLEPPRQEYIDMVNHMIIENEKYKNIPELV